MKDEQAIWKDAKMALQQNQVQLHLQKVKHILKMKYSFS